MMQAKNIQTFEIDRCFAESFQVWRKDFLVFSLASLLVVAISAASFTVLMGSMYGGLVAMILAAMRGRRPELRDLFKQLRHFFPLFVTVWFAVIITLAGLIMLVVPGLFLGASCFYLLVLAVDRGTTFDEAFVRSRKTVKKYGFWKHLILGLVALGIPTISMLMMRKIELVSLGALALPIPILLQPFAVGLLVSAYRQTIETEEEARRRYDMEYEFMRDELETAHDMQMGLLPDESPKIPGYSIAGACVPANHVGGDYFAFRPLDEGARVWAVVMADVSGKAMAAAVNALRFNEMLRYELRGRTSPGEVLGGLQETLQGQLEPDSFVTCCVSILDTADGTVEIANAGHCYPLHYSRADRSVVPVELNGYALGLPSMLLTDEPYNSVRVHLDPGNSLAIFTDGVADAENEAGEFYGEARLRDLIRSTAAGASAERIVEAVIESVEEFSAGAARTDDFSIVVVKREEA